MGASLQTNIIGAEAFERCPAFEARAQRITQSEEALTRCSSQMPVRAEGAEEEPDSRSRIGVEMRSVFLIFMVRAADDSP